MPTADITVVRDEANGFQLALPSHWVALDAQPPVVLARHAVVTPGSFATNVVVTSEPTPAAFTGDWETYMLGVAQAMAWNLTDARVLDHEERRIAERPGARMLVLYRRGPFAVTVDQHYVAAGDRLWTLSVSCDALAYDDLADDIAQMAATLAIQ